MLSWLWQRLRPARAAAPPGQAHMTFGQTSIGRSMSRTGLFLKKQLWIWPIIAVVVLAVIGFAVKSAIERTMQASLKSELQTLLSVERSMLETWLKVQESNAETLANDPQVRRLIAEILAAEEAAKGGTGPKGEAELKAEELQARLAKELEPAMSSHDFVGYVVTDKSQQIVAAYTRSLIGTTVPEFDAFLTRVAEGTPTVSPPFPSIVMLKDKSGRLRSGVPTMFVAAPVRDENLQVVAVLAMRIRPEQEFTRILQLGRIGDSGETYAFDKSGLIVSNSRFDEELILLGLLPDTGHAAIDSEHQLRDPGGDMTAGFRPKVRRARVAAHARLVAAAIAGNSGRRCRRLSRLPRRDEGRGLGLGCRSTKWE